MLPPLYIKLGLMKQFVKALDKNGGCFKYLCRFFPGLSLEKLKAGIFDGSQIRKLISDPNFTKNMTDVELSAWSSFVSLVKNYLGNHEALNYVETVENMLTKYQEMGANMSIKVHFLHSHLDRFRGLGFLWYGVSPKITMMIAIFAWWICLDEISERRKIDIILILSLLDDPYHIALKFQFQFSLTYLILLQMKCYWKRWMILIAATVVVVALPAWLLQHLRSMQNQNPLVKAN